MGTDRVAAGDYPEHASHVSLPESQRQADMIK